MLGYYNILLNLIHLLIFTFWGAVQAEIYWNEKHKELWGRRWSWGINQAIAYSGSWTLCHGISMLLFYHWCVTEVMMFISASSLSAFREWIEGNKKKLARGPGDLVSVIQARNDEAWKSNPGDDEWTDSRNSRILWLIRCLRRAQGECSGTCGSQPWVPGILCSLIKEICKSETVWDKSWKTCHVVGKQTNKTKHDLRIEFGDGGCFHALHNRASLENTQNKSYCFGMLFF